MYSAFFRPGCKPGCGGEAGALERVVIAGKIRSGTQKT